MSDVALFDSQIDGDSDATIDVSSSAPTFDDFDSAEEAREQYIESKTQEVKEREGKKGEPKVEAKKAETQETRAEDAQKKEDADKDVDPSMAPDPEKTMFKMVKGASLSGDPYDLPQDLSVPVKVDGELTEVRVQDLINDFSGKTSWDRKFSELDVQRKTYEKEKEQTFDIINGFSSLAKEGKVVDAMKYLVDMTGANSHDFHVSLRNAMLPEIENYLYMSDDERAAHDTALEAQYLKQQIATQKEEQQHQTQRWETEREAVQVRERLGVSGEEYEGAVKFLQSQGVEATPEVVGQYYNNLSALNKSEELLSTIDDSLGTNEELKVEVAQIINSGEFTESEVLAQLKELYGNQDAKAVSQKIAEAKPKTPTDAVKTEPLRSFESFDDFDEDEYYAH